MPAENLEKALEALKNLGDDLNDDFRWLEAIRKIRGLGDDLLFTSSESPVKVLFDLCDQIATVYPTDDVVEIRNRVLSRVEGLIKTIVYRQTAYAPDRDDAKQTAYKILIARLERGLTQLTPRYVGLLVMEAVHGARRSYQQVLAECRRQAKAQLHQHRAEYERICKETNQQPTDARFDKYVDNWCKEFASDILNNLIPISEEADEGGVELIAPEPPPEMSERELEDFHAKVKRALMAVPRVPPARLIHTFYQVYIFRTDQNDLATELGCDEGTISRDVNPKDGRILKALESLMGSGDYEEVKGYFGGLKRTLPETVHFARPNDLRSLLSERVDRDEAGEVMWEVYDWFRKNWCLPKSSTPLHVNLGARWYMDVKADFYDESATITRLAVRKAFRR